MTLTATLRDHRRSAERHELSTEATVRIDGHPLDALVANVSATGCLFICATPLEVGDTMTIGIAGIGRRSVQIVRALGSRFGAEFLTPLTPSEIERAGAVLGETVVSFPSPVERRPDDESRVSAPPILPGLARLAIVTALAIPGWGILIALLRAAS